jgi:hypothetical protein
MSIVYQVYFEQHKVKPAALVDLPVFSKIFWIPIVSAFALYASRERVLFLVRPVFKIIGKDK